MGGAVFSNAFPSSNGDNSTYAQANHWSLYVLLLTVYVIVFPPHSLMTVTHLTFLNQLHRRQLHLWQSL